jgi:hypothetical protein
VSSCVAFGRLGQDAVHGDLVSVTAGLEDKVQADG